MNEPVSSKRKYYEFVLELGIRLNLPSKIILNASVYVYRLLKLPIVDKICIYTLAAACIFVACQQEGYEKINVRDVTNISHRILHPKDEMLAIDEVFWDIREGITRLTFVILRELKFDLDVQQPHNHVMLYIALIRDWIPNEVETKAELIEKYTATLLQDLCVWPEFFEDHRVETIAAVILGCVLNMADIDIDDEEWVEKLAPKLDVKKFRKLEKEVLENVYQQSVEKDEPRAKRSCHESPRLTRSSRS